MLKHHRRRLLAAVAGPVVGMVVAAVVSWVMPAEYESRAVVQVVGPLGRDFLPATGEGQQFMAEELGLITGRRTFETVADGLELSARWGMNRGKVMEELGQAVCAKQMRDTDLAEIIVRHTNAKDARDVAMAIAQAYHKQRQDAQKERDSKDLEKLEGAVREQAEQMEAKRRRVMAIIRVRSIESPPDSGLPFSLAGAGDHPESDKGNQNQFLALAKERVKTERQLIILNTLERFPADDLVREDDLPNQELKEPWRAYVQACATLKTLQRELEDLAVWGIINENDSHSLRKKTAVEVQQRLARELRDQMATGLPALKKTLEEKFAELGEKLERLGDGETPGMLAAKLRETPEFDYLKAMEAFGAAQDAWNEAQEHLRVRRIQSELPHEWVVLHEKPVLAGQAVSPDWPQNLGFGAAAGLVLAVPGIFLLGRRPPRPA